LGTPPPEPVRETTPERDDRLCAACGVRRKDFSESPHSILCEECRERHIRLRVPLGVKLFLLAVCALFALSMVALPDALEDYRVFVSARRHQEAREYSLAFRDYVTVLEGHSGRANDILDAIDAAIDAQYFGEAIDLFNEHLQGRDLSDSQLERVETMQTLLTAYSETGLYVDTVAARIVEENPDDPERVTELMTEALEGMLASQTYDKTFVYYYLGMLTQDSETALQYLQRAAEQDARFTYPLAEYGKRLRRTGDFDAARRVFADALERNATDGLALREVGVLQLLEGDPVGGAETLRRAYELEPYGMMIADARIVALCESGRRDEAEALLEAVQAEGFVADETLLGYLDGSISLREVYLD
jgi:tetratricopeptide (TPR) repeat protein